VLSTLARTGPLTVARLAEHVGIDRSGTSRYADRLQQAGLLERQPGPADRRMSLISLTPEGARLAAWNACWRRPRPCPCPVSRT